MSIELLSFNSGFERIIAFPLVFAGGVVSGLNPCCFSYLPALVLINGRQATNKKKHRIYAALCLASGFALSIALLGALAVTIGITFGHIGRPASYFIGIIPILMGLNVLGVLGRFEEACDECTPISGYVHGILIGLVFGLTLAPCAAPIVVSILAYLMHSQNLWYGTSLLFTYGLGVGLPILIIAAGMETKTVLSLLTRYRTVLNKLIGVGLLIFGLYLLSIS